MSNLEQTLSIIKPDAVERNLENEIKEMFKNNGFSIVKEKKIQIEKSGPIFPRLVGLPLTGSNYAFGSQNTENHKNNFFEPP